MRGTSDCVGNCEGRDDGQDNFNPDFARKRNRAEKGSTDCITKTGG